MKLSVSLPDDDVAFLDRHARERGMRSRSAAVQDAVRLLRHAGLEAEYAAAGQEWDGSADQTAWESVSGDGIG